MKVAFIFFFFYTVFQLASAILDRDFYDYLELPVSATSDMVRQAFRRLSKKYHPDRNPQSKDRFEKINVAYEVLMDNYKKYLYDRLGKQKVNEPNIQQQYNLQALKGPELKMKINLPLKDFYLGTTIPILIEKRVACPHCKGTGAQNPHDVVTCRQCGGKGKVTKRIQLGGGYYNLFTNTCPRCEGRGKVIGRKCHLCSSQKIIQGVEQFNFTVSPGTPSGYLSKYQNMGDQRLEGAPSDLIFELLQISHPYFRRQGNDLWTVQVLTLKQALLGYTKKIIHLDGRQILIDSQEITQPGYIRVVENEGMPILNQRNNRGHLYIEFKVTIPEFGQEQLYKLEQFFEQFENK